MRFASDQPIPLTLTIVDQGNIFRSKVVGYFLRQAMAETIGRTTDPDTYPIICTARVQPRRPDYENITQYDFWKNDEDAFRRLFEEEFGISVVALAEDESVEITPEMIARSDHIYGVSRQDVIDLETRFPEFTGQFERFSEIAGVDLDFADPSKSLTVEVAREMMTRLREICFRWVGLHPELRDLEARDELCEERRSRE